jgi:hypothetical protein
MNVDVHIDRMILKGISLSPDVRLVLETAIESELSRLIEEDGWQTPDIDTHISRLNAKPLRLSQSLDAASLGQQVARSVYGEVSR